MQHLELQSLYAIAQGLLPLPYGPGAEFVLARELAAALELGSSGSRSGRVIGPGDEAALLEICPGLESLNAAVLALNLSIGAGEEEGDVGTDFVAQG